jgi:Ni,Fe-hydrogenase maturation factor
MKVFVFGNPLVEKDSLPLKLLPKLRKQFPEIDFVVADPTESLLVDDDEFWILDVAKNIDEVVIFDDILKLDLPKRMSVHDYDLALDLRLLEKLGKLKKVKIIAVPVGMKYKEALVKISSHLRTGLE